MLRPQPQAVGAGAVPPAWTLTVARQVLLVVGGQLAGVILLPPYRELGDVGHHPAAPLPHSLAPATHRWCIALLRRLRVERRANGEASSVMAATADWVRSCTSKVSSRGAQRSLRY